MSLTLARAIWQHAERDMKDADRQHIQEELKDIVNDNKLIKRVVIVSNTRQVYASSSDADNGTTIICPNVVEALQSGEPVVTRSMENGQPTFCAVLPIPNRPECAACHSSEAKFLGAVEIDVDREPLLAQLRQQVNVIAVAAGATILAAGLALTYSLRRSVVNPMAKMVTEAVSEREKQAKLYLTDRLASIGELASGIAHEVNNPLTSVIGFSQLVLEKGVPDDIKRDVETIHDEAQRAARVMKNLLTFARKHSPMKQLTDINGIIQKVLEIRAYEQRVNNIQVVSRLAPYLPEIMVDPFQMQQVFFNLTINAEHFMHQAHGKGTLTIVTEKAGDIIRIYFADDGPGIPKEHMKRLFTPFFTTKETGKGTGLGLSICHGIVSEHGGRIYAQSEPGKGATFVVELPILTATDQAQAAVMTQVEGDIT